MSVIALFPPETVTNATFSNKMSKELKTLVYYCIRRRWYNTVVNQCDAFMAKKGKEPTALYWKAFGTGMTGNPSEALRLLDGFQSRRDLQLPVALAMMYFHKKTASADREAINSLRSELAVAEDVAVPCFHC